MKRYAAVMSVTAIALLTGCGTFTYDRVPTGNVLGTLNSTANYDVIGDAKGTAKGTTCCGFIPWDSSDQKHGIIGQEAPLVRDPVMSEAYYNAIQSVPTADALMTPRYEKTVVNNFFTQDITVTVKAKAIRVNNSK